MNWDSYTFEEQLAIITGDVGLDMTAQRMHRMTTGLESFFRDFALGSSIARTL